MTETAVERSPATWPISLYETDHAIGLSVCVAHRGAHVWYLDGCQALPAQRPPFTQARARCLEEGCRLAAETPHVHAPATRIEIDVESLAEAIVRASRATRDERQQRPSTQAAATAPPAPTVPTGTPGDQSIPTVTVWSPGPDDGPGT